LNTLVPIQDYTVIFHHFTLVICLIIFIQSTTSEMSSISNRKNNNALATAVFIITLLYMGLRPINYRFGDMVLYNYELQSMMMGNPPKGKVEFLFNALMQFFATIKNPELFFFTCAVLYVVPLYVVSKRMFGDYWSYAFFMLIFAFTFWPFGVNGIRNGIAGSIFLLAISEPKKMFKYALFAASVLIHKSLALPLAAYLVSKNIKNVKLYFLFWVLCIPVSLALGSFLENFFLGLGFSDDERLTVYLSEFDQQNEGVELKLGFRWDFILYSGTAVFAAWYFIFKKKIEDAFYNNLVATYLVSNGFWILIIRANYSSRFAYLSWFMMGLVILYPLLKYKLYENQHKIVGLIILSFCSFAYLLNVILT
jgi:hypothetical protein